MERAVLTFSIVLLLSMAVLAQNRFLRKAEAQSPVVAAFNHQCATARFPKAELQKLIRKAIKNAPDQASRTDGDHAVGYDLNGDGNKEYFIVLKDSGIGDNVLWGIFSLQPKSFLG